MLLPAGEYPLPPGTVTVYTPLQTHFAFHYYNVKLLQINIEGKSLGMDMVGQGGGGTGDG